jgi:hypothetical protein
MKRAIAAGGTNSWPLPTASCSARNHKYFSVWDGLIVINCEARLAADRNHHVLNGFTMFLSRKCRIGV